MRKTAKTDADSVTEIIGGETYREQGVWTAIGTRTEDEDGRAKWTLERHEGYVGSGGDFVLPLDKEATRADAEEAVLWQEYGGADPLDREAEGFARWRESHEAPSIEWEPTTAQQVAEIMGGDGQVWEAPDGRTLAEVCKEMGARKTARQFKPDVHPEDTWTFEHVHQFEDGSMIVESEGGWRTGAEMAEDGQWVGADD